MKPETEYTKFIEQRLREAAKIASRNFGRVSRVAIKGTDNNQVLTETDLKISQLIISKITKSYPNHNIIDEETGVMDRKAEYTWVIDPIDGTSNFAEGVPTYGIIIGLLHKDKPIAGGIALPFFNGIYLAEKGKGAYCNGKRLRVEKETRLLSSLIAYSIDGHQENPQITYEECKALADIVLGIRNLRISGSVFDNVMVIQGKYGGYLGLSSKIWDNVGAQVLTEESGGIYTDFFGKPMDYSNPLSKSEQNFTWCIGAPAIHKQLQQIIHKSR